MLDYMEYLETPATVGVAVVTMFFIMQIIGELIEFKGKAVPEIFKMRKFFARKKEEREILRKLPETLNKMNELINSFENHYSNDNIAKRNQWMNKVNEKLEHSDDIINKLDKKLDKNCKDTQSLLLDQKRNALIDFAANVSDGNSPVTKERFNRMFKLYREYENIIEENGLTNGEIDIAYRIIVEAYEEHMRNHTFLEDLRGWE